MEEKERLSISAEEFAATVEANYEPYTDIKWHGLDIIVKKNLSIEEMKTFVDAVTKSCFVADTDEYTPEAKNFAIQWGIISLYTNIELPDDTAEVYSIIYKSHIIDEIIHAIDRTQLEHMIDAIDERVEHKINSAIEATNKQISTMFSALESIESNMDNLFGNISGDDIKQVISAISDGGIDEKKLVDAIVATKQE